MTRTTNRPLARDPEKNQIKMEKVAKKKRAKLHLDKGLPQQQCHSHGNVGKRYHKKGDREKQIMGLTVRGEPFVEIETRWQINQLT